MQEMASYIILSHVLIRQPQLHIRRQILALNGKDEHIVGVEYNRQSKALRGNITLAWNVSGVVQCVCLASGRGLNSPNRLQMPSRVFAFYPRFWLLGFNQALALATLTQ